MTEIILAIVIAYGFGALLIAFVYQQKKERETLTNAYEANQKFLDNAFDKYLKHIEKLERMTLPKPVTVKDVQSVITRGGEITDVGKFDNDIEQTEDKGVELPSDEWTGFINADTKVAFEDEEAPTLVE